MTLMSFRMRSHVKESMVLTRADYLFMHNYIRSLLNNILRPIFLKLINGPDEARTRVLLPSNQNHKMHMYRNSSCVLVLVKVFW